jgi:signal peptidase II
MKSSQKQVVFWSIAVIIAVVDFITKRLIENTLVRGQSVEVIGDFLRFTLGYNTGIAFGISVGGSSRILLIAVTLLTMGLIVWLFRSVDARHKLQIIAFGLIMGGAIGNLLDRMFGKQGVVDFIDVGIGTNRFWTFNIADSGITVGAILLILGSLFEKHDHRPA